jgi:hypothetical protein
MELSDQDRGPVHALKAAFDAWKDRHRAGLITLRTVASFALLLGAAAHATYPLASAKAVQGWCGPACVTMPGYDIVAALAFGALIVLLATAYAVLTATAYRALRRTRLRRAGVKEFAGLGLIYLAMVIIQLDPVLSGHRSNFFLGSYHSESFWEFELAAAWFVGGLGVLEFIWMKLAPEPVTSPL